MPNTLLLGSSRSGPLPPLLDSHIARFIKLDHARLHALVARYGSPLNIVWPHAVARNAEGMRRVFASHDVDCEIFYGAKVNKSQALVRAAVAADVGIDVSSLAEFGDAVRAGVDPSRICATGPAKTVPFLEALVAASSLIAVDSLEELADLELILIGERRARILLRLRPASEVGSRFGMDHDAVLDGLHRVARITCFAFEGFHMHLADYAAASRVEAMPELISLVDAASRLSLSTHVIDIGGGLPIRYVAPDAYAAALRNQRPDHYRAGKVPADFYPYGSEQTAGDWLHALLSAPCREGTIASYLRDRGLRLAIEPGRSLVDQAAVSVFRVTRVKPLGNGMAVIFVEGSSFSACETWCRSEFLIDPIYLPASPHASGSGALRAYIAGHSCLGDDVVTNRLLEFPTALRSGDLLIYANTAGYQMDLLENEFHRHPMPTRIVADVSADGSIAFGRDT